MYYVTFGQQQPDLAQAPSFYSGFAKGESTGRSSALAEDHYTWQNPARRYAASSRATQRALKEIAEHNMIVDLHRNDIGRVAQFGTVKVRSLMDIKTL